MRRVGTSTFKKSPPDEHIRNLVQVHGTSEAYINLINNRADLILVARSPSEDELIQAAKLGVQLDVRPVALDAFVFLLNGKNPVTDLTIEQIRDIYSGQIVNWREVGGPDAHPAVSAPGTREARS